jgi:hypothetical protein
MSKKETAITNEVAASLDANLQSVFAALTDAEKAEMSVMSPEERVQALELMASLSASAEFSGDTVFKDAKPEQDTTVVLSPGGMGLRAGTKFVAYLQGTIHIFAKDIKENWKEYKEGNKTYFYNSNYKFRDLNGKEFKIWASPTLRILEKIPTHSATPSLVKSDPLVEIHYIGKIEGKEVLKQEYGIELTKGNSAHVFKVKVAEGVKFNPYVKACVNSLNSPFPIQSSDSNESVTREEATRAMYERLMALQGGNEISAFIAQ